MGEALCEQRRFRLDFLRKIKRRWLKVPGAADSTEIETELALTTYFNDSR